MAYAARVVLDTIAQSGCRLVTVEATYPRFIHSEVLTHRMLSRNSSSSRAIPAAKMRAQVIADPVMPVHWGRNQPGMQAGGEIDETTRHAARHAWLMCRDEAVASHEQLEKLGVHKQITNRILEPWMWITVLISATEWSNFFAQRCHTDAQPEIRHAAELIRSAIAASTPQQPRRPRRWNVNYFSHSITTRAWHWPFVSDEEIAYGWDETELCKLSTARCARVSYNTHDGRYSPMDDIKLADRLVTASPPHWSPTEHCAIADTVDLFCGNFRGWVQYRKTFANEDGAL